MKDREFLFIGWASFTLGMALHFVECAFLIRNYPLAVMYGVGICLFRYVYELTIKFYGDEK